MEIFIVISGVNSWQVTEIYKFLKLIHYWDNNLD